MEVLLGVQMNINHFYDIKKKIDNILAQNSLTLTNKYKLDILRKDLLQDLSNILSLRCDDVLSTSFYMQVNNVETKIISLLNLKQQELEALQSSKIYALDIVKKIVSLIYSIDVLQNSIHIRLNSDNTLLDLKTRVEKFTKNNKIVYALDYMFSKLNLYRDGMIYLIDLARLYNKKEQIPLDKKQEVLNVFNKISLESQYDKNRRNIYSKDQMLNSYEVYTIDYLNSYEQIFIECCSYLDVKLTSFYDKMKDIIYKDDISKTHILNCIDFIYKKYYKSISKEYENISLENQALLEKVKENIISLYTYEGMTILENVLNDINNERKLPSYLQNNRFKEYIQNILFDFDVSIKDGIEVYNIIDELNDMLLKKFDFNKYLELFELNTTKVRQISEFRQYYIKLLEESKEELIKKYVILLEDVLNQRSKYIYNTEEENIKINEKQKQIELLKESLSYINMNYRKFDKQNLKIYISTLEEKYQLPNLYQKVIKKKSNLGNKMKLKSIIRKENLYISEFIEKEDISSELMSNIIKNVIISDEDLKNEVINFVNNKDENVNDKISKKNQKYKIKQKKIKKRNKHTNNI